VLKFSLVTFRIAQNSAVVRFVAYNERLFSQFQQFKGV